MLEDSVGTGTNVGKRAQNKFSLETGRLFLMIREQWAAHEPPLGSRRDETSPALAGAGWRAGPGEPGVPCSPMLLLLSVFSYDFCLGFMFMPILITSRSPPCPLIGISVAGIAPFPCRWLAFF